MHVPDRVRGGWALSRRLPLRLRTPTLSSLTDQLGGLEPTPPQGHRTAFGLGAQSDPSAMREISQLPIAEEAKPAATIAWA